MMINGIKDSRISNLRPGAPFGRDEDKVSKPDLKNFKIMLACGW